MLGGDGHEARTGGVMNGIRFAAFGAAAVVIAVATGFLGLSMFFSDLGPSESVAFRVLTLVLLYALGAGSIGALVPRIWYVALLAAWGPVLLSLPVLLNRGAVAPSSPAEQMQQGLLGLVVVPLAALAFSYVGMRLRRRFEAE